MGESTILEDVFVDGGGERGSVGQVAGGIAVRAHHRRIHLDLLQG